jgi:ATP-binding cassette, subfamily C, bacterial CydC
LAALPLIQQRNTLHASQYMHRLVNDIDKLDEFILRVISPWLVGSVSVLLLALFISWALPVSAVSKITIYLLLLLALLLPLIVSLRGINRAKKLSQVSEARRQKLLAPLAIITQLLLWRQWQTQTQGYTAQDNELQKLEWSAQKLRSTVMLLIQWFFYAAVLMVLFSIFQLSSNATSPQAVLNNIDVPLVLAVTRG